MTPEFANLLLTHPQIPNRVILTTEKTIKAKDTKRKTEHWYDNDIASKPKFVRNLLALGWRVS